MNPRAALLAAAAWLFAPSAAAQEPSFVTLDGHRVHVRIAGLPRTGGGTPTVVFESGLAGRLEAWSSVFDQVSIFAPAVAYERAGNGQSEPDGEAPAPRHVARRLRRLLAQVGAPGPYVLVGHSWGGPLIRMFAAEFPRDVAGLVYVDPTDMRTEDEDRAYLRARGYAAAEVEAFRKRRRDRLNASHPEMKIALGLEETFFAEFHALGPPPDVPAAVLMAARFDAAPWAGEPCPPRQCHDAWVRLRIGWLSALARQASDAIFLLKTDAGHDLPNEDPALVAWAIQRVSEAAVRRRR